MIGVLKIKLGKCHTAPTKRFRADLLEVARLCNKARNAMARAWQRWHEDHAGWVPPQAADKDSQPRSFADGRPVPGFGAYPLIVTHQGRLGDFRQVTRPGCKRKSWVLPDGTAGVGFTTYLYHFGRAAAPALNPVIVSTLAREVVARLLADTPYDHEGKAKYRWQAVLWDEVNLDTHRAVMIPVKAGSSRIHYGDFHSDGRPNGPTVERLEKAGSHGCALAFPLFNPSAGRRWFNVVVSLRVRAFSHGHRTLLRHVVRGDEGFSVADSKVVRGKDGKGWYLHLTYEHPATADANLDPNSVAVLTVGGEGDYPFALATADGASEWKRVGFGPYFKRAFQRLNNRRRDFHESYPSAGHGRKGHGHRRAERDVRPVSRAVNYLANDIACKTAADVVKFCTRFGCGKLQWQEPHRARRDSLWFARNHVQWDWTLFGSRLKNQCAKAGIVIVEPDKPAKTVKPRKN